MKVSEVLELDFGYQEFQNALEVGDILEITENPALIGSVLTRIKDLQSGRIIFVCDDTWKSWMTLEEQEQIN